MLREFLDSDIEILRLDPGSNNFTNEAKVLKMIPICTSIYKLTKLICKFVDPEVAISRLNCMLILVSSVTSPSSAS